MTKMTSNEAVICSVIIKNSKEHPQIPFPTSHMLCEGTNLTEEELSQVLNIMKEKGYIIMLENKSNSNSYYVTLTPKGRAAYKKENYHTIE